MNHHSFKDNAGRHEAIIKIMQLSNANLDSTLYLIRRLAYELLAITPGGVHSGTAGDKLDQDIGDLLEMLQDQQNKINQQAGLPSDGRSVGDNLGNGDGGDGNTPCSAILLDYQNAIKANDQQKIKQFLTEYMNCMSTPHPGNHRIPGRLNG